MMRLFQRLPLSRKILLGIVPLFLLFVSLSVAINNRLMEVDRKTVYRKMGEYSIDPSAYRTP